MSVPPERLSIKRSRDDDPVDCLYLDQKQKRVRSEYVWQRVGSELLSRQDAATHSPHESHATTSASVHGSHSPQAPIVKATLPGEEYSKPQNRVSSLFQNINVSAGHQNGQRDPKTAGTAQRPVPSTPARQFHLTKASFPSPSLAKDGNGIRKHTKKDKRNVAILMEKKAELFLESKLGAEKSKPANVVVNDDSMLPQETSHIETTPLKRPGASAEEAKWRARTRDRLANPSSSTPSATEAKKDTLAQSSTSEDDLLALAEQLHDFALQFPTPVSQAPVGTAMPASKFKPKTQPPRPRPETLHEETTDGDAMAVDADSKNENSYTYDTYVRVKGPSHEVWTEDFQDQATMEGLQWDKVGVLVIDDKDEPIWQEYLEDAEDEEEWDDADEDENAEDYYANDYPEDELESDDEYGRQAYGYRVGASDDEEFDEEYDSCSEDELEKETSLGRATTDR